MPEAKELIEKRLALINQELASLEDRKKQLLLLKKEYTGFLNDLGFSIPVQIEMDQKQTKDLIQEMNNLSNHFNFKRLNAIDTIRDILRIYGQPMKISDIARIAIDGGYGKENAELKTVIANFSSSISRSLRLPDTPFIKVGRGFIGLKG